MQFIGLERGKDGGLERRGRKKEGKKRGRTWS